MVYQNYIFLKCIFDFQQQKHSKMVLFPEMKWREAQSVSTASSTLGSHTEWLFKTHAFLIGMHIARCEVKGCQRPHNVTREHPGVFPLHSTQPLTLKTSLISPEASATSSHKHKLQIRSVLMMSSAQSLPDWGLAWAGPQRELPYTWDEPLLSSCHRSLKRSGGDPKHIRPSPLHLAP